MLVLGSYTAVASTGTKQDGEYWRTNGVLWHASFISHALYNHAVVTGGRGYRYLPCLEWYQGDLVRLDKGDVVQRREDWVIWLAAGLGLFSVLSRLLFAPILAKPDRGERSVDDRGNGIQIAGPNGSCLYVEALGNASGQTLILTHGWAMDSTIWHYAKQTLGKRFRIVVWDLPGLGQSKGKSVV